jgi:hypothetical protein
LIASDWPVCAISETATPRRMGAALTYARRYALFTLVGIAGEDDLDTPDLNTPVAPASAAAKPAPNELGRLNGGQADSVQNIPSRRGTKVISNPTKPILGAEASAILRDQLAGELTPIASSDEAASWAHQILGAKYSLTAADARQVEDAFLAKLTTLEGPADVSEQTLSSVIAASQQAAPLKRRSRAPGGTAIADGIDKSRLAHPEPRRFRDKEHVRFVAKQPCLICGRRPADPHHLRFTQHRAIGRKVSDEFTVPLCRGLHREVHRSGDEAAWWKHAGLDPTVTARALWLKSHPLPTSADQMGGEGASSPTAVGADQKNAKRDRPITTSGPDDSSCQTKARGP